MMRLAGALLGTLLASGASAADSGFYIGAGAGQASVDDRAGGQTYQAREESYRAFLGYRLRAARLLDLAGEATYIDYGSGTQTVAGQGVQFHLRGYELAGLAILPLGIFDLYGRVGGVSWSSTKSVNGNSTDRSGTNGLYGLGVGFRADKLGVRAEYDYYDVSAVDKLKTFALSFTFRFY